MTTSKTFQLNPLSIGVIVALQGRNVTMPHPSYLPLIFMAPQLLFSDLLPTVANFKNQVRK